MAVAVASAVAIALSQEERSELERRAGTLTLSYRDVQRAKVVLYAAEGMSVVEIAGRLEMCSKVVGQWRRRFGEQRLERLHDQPRSGRPRRLPPHEVAQVKAIACELPKTHGVPLSRFSRSELHRFVVEQAISEASASTIARRLTHEAIRPWRQRSWMFPRDPRFLEHAGPILDLYAGRWQGTLLEPGDCIISRRQALDPSPKADPPDATARAGRRTAGRA